MPDPAPKTAPRETNLALRGDSDVIFVSFELIVIIPLSQNKTSGATIPAWMNAMPPRPWNWSARCAINCTK